MTPEHLDVLVIGAGLSGIAAGYHLQDKCANKTYAILEARERSGGTWDLFNYPGVRSDSDMYTLGYAFRPWAEGEVFADGQSILGYVRETAAEFGIDRHIRLGHRAVHARWSTPESRWSVVVERTDTGETTTLTCDFLFICGGYYRYDEGYTPEFKGRERFAGQIVHPQQWTDEVDYEEKRVAVIGSGATAVTIVPALAPRAAHVTMVQRSPSYILTVPLHDPLAALARRWAPPRAAFEIVRWKNVLTMMVIYQVSRRRPEVIKSMIRKGVQRQLPPGYDVDTHFTPTYNPWDQRLCFVPDGDLFAAISRGRASVATGDIDTFTERGIRLVSGEEVEADVIVTATGLRLLPLGGMTVEVDGRPVELPETLSYKGMMLSDVPNLAIALGYTNASWTLKCDLTCEYVCRVLRHMDAHGYRQCTPRNRDPTVKREPILDFSSGYIQRSIKEFPKQGSKRPWRLYQNYLLDIVNLRMRSLEDGALEFSAAGAARSDREPIAGH
jgi:monooxygenase